MGSLEYFTVFILVMYLCHTSEGACRCRKTEECQLPYAHCVNGCEFGFTGRRCQYANLLAYSSCRGRNNIVGRNAFVTDGKYQTCQKLDGYLKCPIDPSATANTIRIIHGRYKAPPTQFYVGKGSTWGNAEEQAVTNKTKVYSFTRNYGDTSFITALKTTACEIELSNECTSSGPCFSECNCFNASDCLIDTSSCPSGCALGYSNVDGGCQESKVATIPDTKKQSTPTKGSVQTEMSTNPTVHPTVEQVCRHDQCYGHGTCENVNQKPRCNCYDGYTGSRCENECNAGFYGPDCSKTCNEGCVPEHCNHVNGNCNRKCKDGWTGGNCKQKCNAGFYGPDCSMTCNEGCVPEHCNHVNGNCNRKCKDGWTGGNCKRKCTGGTYGHNCSLSCPPGCFHSKYCDHITGECYNELCIDGWTHLDDKIKRCDKICPNSTYGRGCRSPCGEGCQEGTCHHVDGRCNCKAGWEGDRCDTRCRKGRYGDRCHTPCGDGCRDNCHHVDGSCSCKDGWIGHQCSTQCPEGRYGHNCSSPCSPGCFSTQPCNPASGACLRVYHERKYRYCKDGWRDRDTKSKRCDKKECSTGCKGGCDHTDGRCDRCKPGWTHSDNKMPMCDVKCPEGRYGHNCSSPCSPGCFSTQPCNPASGACLRVYHERKYRYCKDGWRDRDTKSKRCDKKECSTGCKGGCDHTDGRCDRCKPGWTHSDNKMPMCDVKCPTSRYGAGCRKSCAEGCQRGTCDHVDGGCDCKPGWTGDQCTTICPNTTYGAGCHTPCGEGCQGGTCQHVNGRCNCKAGWEGRRCDTRCRNWMYGDGCSSPCAGGCREKCHHVNGSCRCKDGWTGHQCSTQCSDGFYGGNCSKTCNEGCIPEHCDHVNGNCNEKCKDGWKYWNCKKKCGGRRYGPGCTKTCGPNCISCHHVSGSCASDCKSGHYGVNCTGTCPPGFYGDGCKSECNKGCKPEKCNSTNGRCGPDCKEGWAGENCIDECVPGTYGENCVFNCSEGCINQTCDRVSGRCENCLEGWQHQDQDRTSRCDKKCDNGTYGEGCGRDCSVHCMNQSCHHVEGACLYGCLDGRSGIYCEVSLKDGPDTGTIYIVPICIVLILLLVIFLLYLFREPLKKRLKSTREAADGESFPMERNQRPSGRQDIDEEGPGVVMNGSDNIYANYSIIASSTCVPITGLKEYVEKKKSKKTILSDEYAKLPQGLTEAHDIALTERNSPKNRFRGIYPYNHSLVAIKTSKGKPGYINANYIDGLTRGKQYIATQGPLPHTVEDFWEMIWQHNVPVIAMLANVMEDGKRRCEAYWPNEPDITTLTWGSITVSVSDECTLADSTIRTLKLQKGREIRTVKHVHYRVWPDKGVPSDTMSLVALRHKVRSFCDFNDGPMVVHCSAGVGRTGTLIALDYLMEQADAHNRVDIYGCVWTLRGFRVKMVQTEIQYVFLHDCLLDALWYTPYPMPASLYANEYKQTETGNKQSPNLDVEFKKLEESPVSDHPCKAAMNESNRQKNRTHHILPGDLHRPFLMSQVAGHTDYINAVIVPSYEKQNGYIMTQSPLKSTVVDFWRLIQDQNIRGVVLLDNYTENDNDCGVFWANEGQSSKFGPFTVNRGKVEEHTGFIMENYSYESENGNGDVVVFRCSFWPQKDSLPESTSRFLGFFDFVRQWKSGTAPLVVVCRDGCTRSGLFCVLAYALERLQMENEVAIYHAIRRMRHVRRQVIPTREQFDFCHDAVKTYIESFKAYSNLG